jgi:hypothetical protein
MRQPGPGGTCRGRILLIAIETGGDLPDNAAADEDFPRLPVVANAAVVKQKLTTFFPTSVWPDAAGLKGPGLELARPGEAVVRCARTRVPCSCHLWEKWDREGQTSESCTILTTAGPTKGFGLFTNACLSLSRRKVMGSGWMPR